MSDQAEPAPSAQEPPPAAAKAPVEPPKPASLFSLIKAGDEDGYKKFMCQTLEDLAKKHGLTNYKIVFLFDDVDSITDYHSDEIYRSISQNPNTQDILVSRTKPRRKSRTCVLDKQDLQEIGKK
jgi:hypothetical protein